MSEASSVVATGQCHATV